METIQKDVKSKGQVVGQVEVPKFDDWEEAEGALGEEKCIDLINRQHSINLQDACRQEATGGASSGLREIRSKLKEVDEETRAKVAALLGLELPA